MGYCPLKTKAVNVYIRDPCIAMWLGRDMVNRVNFSQYVNVLVLLQLCLHFLP